MVSVPRSPTTMSASRRRSARPAQDVRAAVLVVGVGVDDDVGAELQRGVQAGLEARGQALVVRQADDVVDAVRAGDLDRAVGGAVVDDEPLDRVEAGDLAREVGERRGEGLLLVQAGDLDDELHHTGRRRRAGRANHGPCALPRGSRKCRRGPGRASRRRRRRDRGEGRGAGGARVSWTVGPRMQRTDTDHLHLARAVELAERGLGKVSPNPLVGAVLVRDGEVLGEGWHDRLRRPARRGRGHPRRRAGPTCAAPRSTSRSSPAATTASRRPAPTRSSRPASAASSSPPTTRPRRPTAAGSGSCATRASR